MKIPCYRCGFNGIDTLFVKKDSIFGLLLGLKRNIIDWRYCNCERGKDAQEQIKGTIKQLQLGVGS